MADQEVMQNVALGEGEGQVSPQNWVDLTIKNAIEAKASDIHIEPSHTQFMVRFRIDGVLQQVDEKPMSFHEMVVSRIKILSQMSITEHRKPQEGHAVVKLNDAEQTKMDLRVSIFPTIFGEAIAMRLLNRKDLLFEGFEQMGMAPDKAALVEEMIMRPHGMILVTGPAGSGKTTTLYTAINKRRSMEKNIITLEDPVEYQFDLVRQAQINADAGFTFAEGMRSILRQDPDVILIGEIRDNETAEIATRAALTGRLLFSTLHTNSAIGAVTRFLEFKIPRSFIASALLMVIAKRLLRANCKECIEPYTPSEKLLKQAGITSLEGIQFYHGVGCEVCKNTGYKGRDGVYEIFVVDPEIEALIIDGASVNELLKVARKNGMQSLREAAVEKALAGITTLEEALHTTQ